MCVLHHVSAKIKILWNHKRYFSYICIRVNNPWSNFSCFTCCDFIAFWFCRTCRHTLCSIDIHWNSWSALLSSFWRWCSADIPLQLSFKICHVPLWSHLSLVTIRRFLLQLSIFHYKIGRGDTDWKRDYLDHAMFSPGHDLAPWNIATSWLHLHQMSSWAHIQDFVCFLDTYKTWICEHCGLMIPGRHADDYYRE